MSQHGRSPESYPASARLRCRCGRPGSGAAQRGGEPTAHAVAREHRWQTRGSQGRRGGLGGYIVYARRRDVTAALIAMVHVHMLPPPSHRASRRQAEPAVNPHLGKGPNRAVGTEYIHHLPFHVPRRPFSSQRCPPFTAPPTFPPHLHRSPLSSADPARRPLRPRQHHPRRQTERPPGPLPL